MFYDANDAKAWGAELQQYKQSRIRNIVPEPQQKITYSMMKQKDIEYNPLLQSYASPEREDNFNKTMQDKKNWQLEKKMDIRRKYEQHYNIINLEKNAYPEKKQRGERELKLLPHNQVEFNIITNEHYYPDKEQREKDDYLSLLNVKYGKKLVRPFNILTNEYCQNHEEKTKEDKTKIKDILDQKYQKTHNYNFIEGRYYDDKKEDDFQKTQEHLRQTHGQDFSKRYPPSWKYREIVILDRTKPIPEELQIVDMRRQNAKKRYQLRYALESEYRDKDIDRQELEKYRALNRIEQKKYYDEKQKGFDLITLDKYKDDEIQPRNIFQSTWDKLQLNSHNYPSSTGSRIQSGGASQHNNNNNNIPLFKKNSERNSEINYQPQPSNNNNNNYMPSNQQSKQPSNQPSNLPSNQISRKQSIKSDAGSQFKIKTVGFSQK